jgi:hypothetical protein
MREISKVDCPAKVDGCGFNVEIETGGELSGSEYA